MFCTQDFVRDTFENPPAHTCSAETGHREEIDANGTGIVDAEHHSAERSRVDSLV